MNASLAMPAAAPATSAARAATLPAYCFVLVVGAVCIPIGVLWDISWHSTIGRDTFWTPAHILTYIGGTGPSTSCAWVATHFSSFILMPVPACPARVLSSR